MVVFLPSYGFLHMVLDKWKASGLMEKINTKKRVGKQLVSGVPYQALTSRAL